jgi:urease gamma subunit
LTEHERERLLITLAADVVELMSAGREVLRRDDVPPGPAAGRALRSRSRLTDRFN